MEITDIRVRIVTKESKIKAVASITFDNELVIHDIKVIEGDKGLFMAMPCRKTSEGDYRDIVHPLNTHTRQKLQDLVLEKYQAIILSEESGALGEAAATQQPG